MRLETLIRKSLRLNAPTVGNTEELPGGGRLAHVDRLPGRRLCCGEGGRPAGKVATTRWPDRRGRDLTLREAPLWRVYAPPRVGCSPCGLRVERTPWAEKWQRGTPALARAVATLARTRDWASVAAPFRLNGKTVARVVEATVRWGLAHRPWVPRPVGGIDAVSRRTGQPYLTLVSDLARRRVSWVGQDRAEGPRQRVFAGLGPRCARAIRVIGCDLGRPDMAGLRAVVPQATGVFDRFPLPRYATEAWTPCAGGWGRRGPRRRGRPASAPGSAGCSTRRPSGATSGPASRVSCG